MMCEVPSSPDSLCPSFGSARREVFSLCSLGHEKGSQSAVIGAPWHILPEGSSQHGLSASDHLNGSLRKSGPCSVYLLFGKAGV